MRIGELAAATGTTSKTLRFYESAGLLPEPDRSGAGYRDYAPSVAARIGFIHRGKAAGLSLAQIRQILGIRDEGAAPCEHVLELLDLRVAELDRQIAQLAELRETIADLRRGADDARACDPEQVCTYL